MAEAEGENLNCCCRFGVCQIIFLLEADQLVVDSVLLYSCPNSEGSFSLCILTVAVHSETTDSSSFLIPNCFGSQHCSNEHNGNVSLLALNKKAFAHLEAISLMNTGSTFYRPGIGGIA